MKKETRNKDLTFDISKYNFENVFSNDKLVQLQRIYYTINKTLPFGDDFASVDWDKCIGLLNKTYGKNAKQIMSFNKFDSARKIPESFFSLIALKKDLLVLHDKRDLECNISILYGPKTIAKDLKIVRDIISKTKLEIPTENKIFLLQANGFGNYYLAPFHITNQIEAPLDFYNDDLPGINKLITTTLNKENGKGLVMLHGTPGTGKTSYIKYLTTQVKKRMIYLSPDLAPLLSTPEFIGVLKEYPDSVIILEDAENIIAQRQGGQNSAVPNLLNLTDGILADCLKIQIICTFNTNLSNIDPALLRQGRLIARYEFKPLTPVKAQMLSDKLGYKTKITSAMSLSEIVGQNSEYRFSENKETRIGF